MSQKRAAMAQKGAARCYGPVAHRNEAHVARRLCHQQVAEGVDQLTARAVRDAFVHCQHEEGRRADRSPRHRGTAGDGVMRPRRLARWAEDTVGDGAQDGPAGLAVQRCSPEAVVGFHAPEC